MTVLSKLLVAGFIGAWPTIGLAQAIDMGACPLNTITFVDPWAQGTFQVQKVGTDYWYLCDGEDTREPVDDSCDGPFGDLYLLGDLVASENSEPWRIYAIWYVNKGVPCCGWSFKLATDEIPASVKWLEGDAVPRLGDMLFVSIEVGEDDDFDFGNQKIAMKCEIPLDE